MAAPSQLFVIIMNDLRGAMQKQIFLLPVILFFIVCSMAGCKKSDQESKQKSSDVYVQISLMGYDFPLTVNQVVKNMGAPDNTYIDHGTCPFGQMHSWNFRDKNYTFMVLGDNYNDKPDLSAGSRLIGVKKISQSRPSKFDGFLDIRLNESSDEVRRKLESFIIKNPTFHILHKDNSTPVHNLFCAPKKFKYQYILENNDTFIYFIINKENRLVAIIKASIDIFSAC
jgi:hypothetical protein